MQSELATRTDPVELLTETLRLPNSEVATVTRQGLLFQPEATEQQLIEIGIRLFNLRAWTKWALGSLFAEMLRKRPHPDARNHPGEFDSSWVLDFANAHDLDPKERREMLGVCTFYAAGEASPAPSLSYEHHREAMYGADTGEPGALKRAQAWLERAASENMGVTQLRRAIRLEGRSDIPEPIQPELAGFGVVFDFRRFVVRVLSDVDSITPQRWHSILSDLGVETLRILDAGRARAASYSTHFASDSDAFSGAQGSQRSDISTDAHFDSISKTSRAQSQRTAVIVPLGNGR